MYFNLGKTYCELSNLTGKNERNRKIELTIESACPHTTCKWMRQILRSLVRFWPTKMPITIRTDMSQPKNRDICSYFLSIEMNLSTDLFPLFLLLLV